MQNLDQLIEKFKEVREDLQKSDSSLHDTVEGFMGGLKALPKGSVERGKFITAHMSHAPFIGALNQHPQGKQLHGMLMNHLNSSANAGPKAVGGVKTLVKGTDDELDDFLSKAYFSSWSKYGPTKKVTPAEKPTKLTGSDKIKAVSKEPIHATSLVADDRKRAAAQGAPSNPSAPKPAKLTGLDRIKAESLKPITATTVKKDEDGDEDEKAPLEKTKSMTGQMLGGGANKLTSPADSSRANMYHEAMSGAFQPPAVTKPTVPAKSPAKLTGLDRIRALQQQPLKRSEDEDTLKQKTADKKYVNKEFSKTVNTSASPLTNSAIGGTGFAKGKEKLCLNKGGQWNLENKIAEDGRKDKPECSKCRAKQCQCDQTGILVDKIDIGSGV